MIWALLACSSPEMVAIPAGSFTMGRDHSPQLDERPAHVVHLSAFELDATLVTVAQFRAYVAETGTRTTAEQLGYGMVAVEGMKDWEWRKTPGASWKSPWGPGSEIVQSDDAPVVTVSWNDADAYCRHYQKRLPTEAEWEYAMSAGSTERFPWGPEPTRENGAYGLNFWQGSDHGKNELSDGHRYTSPVTTFPPNAWGIYDPVGNVWQWVNDWYAEDTFQKDAAGVTNPQGPPSGWAKVARGGSWWCSARTCSGYGVFARGKSQPDAPYPNNGFRCARSANK